MINSNDLKRNALLEIEGAPWQVLDVAFQTPSARGASTIVKAKVKNLKTGQVLSKSYRGGEMLQLADCEKRTVQFLYRSAENFNFMDSESFEQFEMSGEALGEVAGYLLDGMEVLALVYNGQTLAVEPPQVVEMEIIETAPALKNATAQAQLKAAKVETGIEIQVPAYMTTGERVRIDTRDGRYVGRAKG